jgi:hypothetical protein
MWVFFVTLNLATWTNGMAYVVAALSGDHWLGSLNSSRDEATRNWTIWSNISIFLAPILCGAAYLTCFPIMIVGLVMHGIAEKAEADEKDDKKYGMEGKNQKTVGAEEEKDKKKD